MSARRTLLTVQGTGFTANSVVQWNGTPLSTSLSTTTIGGVGVPVVRTLLLASVPAADLATAGAATVTVNTLTATPSLSNAETVTITNPPTPTLTSLSPGAGPINTATAVSLYGTGFTSKTTVTLNGETIPATFVSSTQITATFPASILALPGNFNVAVTTPAPGGGTSSPQLYTTYISMPNNDIAYNPVDGLLYVSVPSAAVGTLGNCIVVIDPVTGTVTRQIQVGSNPNKLAISTDGTQLFVGLDGAASVAQVDLAQGKVVNQFYLGGGPGVYNAPYTAQSLAAVPGSPNSVAVSILGTYGSGNNVRIYDSGVARTNTPRRSTKGC